MALSIDGGKMDKTVVSAWVAFEALTPHEYAFTSVFHGIRDSGGEL